MAPLLTHEKLIAQVIYNPDTGIFTRRINAMRMKAGSIAGGNNGTGYILVSINGKQFTAHRLAWLYVYGKWPDGIIDHINQNRSDNRIANLRESTKSLNAINSKLHDNNTSGICGVDFHKGTQKWRVRICQNYIGVFASKEEAIEARNAAIKLVKF